MELPRSKELELVIKESRDVATRLDQPLTSAHLLLCLFTLKNRASMFLSDQQVTADRLLEALAKRPREAPETWARILRRAREVADVSGAGHISSLHTLVALCSDVDSAAYELVAALDLDLATVRNTALSYLMNPDTTGEAYEGSAQSGDVTSVAPRALDGTADTANRSAGADRPRRVTAAPQRPPRTMRSVEPPKHPKNDRGARQRATKDLAARMFGQSDSGAHDVAPIAQRSPEIAHRVPPSSLPLPPSVRRVGPPAPKQERQTSVARHQLVLRDKQYKLLNQFGRNLTLLAYDGLLDPVVGRDSEIEQVVDILNKRRTNNPVLVGDAGVGKTAVVEGLARQMVGLDNAGTVPGLTGKILIELEASKLVSGTGVRGAFSERIQALKQEVARAKGGIILFLDELHHWIGVGAGG
ncbi:MAG: ATP-dependent Clp protease ATP-binding subunit ClpC, partial [Bradymonadia bacterium]